MLAWAVHLGQWTEVLGEQDALLSSWFGVEAQNLVCHSDLEAKT